MTERLFISAKENHEQEIIYLGDMTPEESFLTQPVARHEKGMKEIETFPVVVYHASSYTPRINLGGRLIPHLFTLFERENGQLKDTICGMKLQGAQLVMQKYSSHLLERAWYKNFAHTYFVVFEDTIPEDNERITEIEENPEYEIRFPFI